MEIPSVNGLIVHCLDFYNLSQRNKRAPLHDSSLVFAYNAMPHSVTGYQPYELMFGQKAPAICDAWLGLAQYNDQASSNKSAWLYEQHELLMSANRRALKHIKQSAKKSQIRTGGKPLQIPVGNLVLLRDHPEGEQNSRQL